MLIQVALLNLRCPAFWPMPHVGGASGRLRLRPAPRQSLPLRSWIWWRTWRGLSFACFAVAAHNRTNCAWPSAIRVRSIGNARAAALCLVRIGNEKRRPLSSHVRRLTYHVCGSFMDNKESRFQFFLLVWSFGLIVPDVDVFDVLQRVFFLQ